MIRPPFLKLNDKAVIISPCGKISSVYINNTEILKNWGLKVEISERIK